MKGIADTGFLVAFANRTDQFHAWAVQLSHQIVEPLLTCEAVLAEATFHLDDANLVLDLVKTRMVQPMFRLDEHQERLSQLAKRFADRKPDLADLCLIRMSELHPQHSILTTDVKEFRVYRRNRRELIPLIVP